MTAHSDFLDKFFFFLCHKINLQIVINNMIERREAKKFQILFVFEEISIIFRGV